MDKVKDNVYISKYATVKNYLLEKPKEEKVAILSIGDFSKPPWGKYPNVTHKHCGDITDADSKGFAAALPDAVSFIQNNKDKDKVIVHCWAGINRSASTVIGWLMLKKGMTFTSALSFLEAKHPDTDPWDQLTKVLKEL